MKDLSVIVMGSTARQNVIRQSQSEVKSSGQSTETAHYLLPKRDERNMAKGELPVPFPDICTQMHTDTHISNSQRQSCSDQLPSKWMLMRGRKKWFVPKGMLCARLCVSMDESRCIPYCKPSKHLFIISGGSDTLPKQWIEVKSAKQSLYKHGLHLTLCKSGTKCFQQTLDSVKSSNWKLKHGSDPSSITWHVVPTVPNASHSCKGGGNQSTWYEVRWVTGGQGANGLTDQIDSLLEIWWQKLGRGLSKWGALLPG